MLWKCTVHGSFVIVTFHVTFETVLSAKGLLTAITGAEEGSFASVRTDVSLKVVACCKGFSTAIVITPKWLFSCVGSNVLPQITECGEVLAAALRFTVKRFPCVKPLMCFQPVQCVERLLTALHITLKWLLLCVHSHVDPKAVGGEEGLAAALLVTDEGVLSAVGLLVGAQVACCAVGAGASLKGALVPLDFFALRFWTFRLQSKGCTFDVSWHGRGTGVYSQMNLIG